MNYPRKMMLLLTKFVARQRLGPSRASVSPILRATV